MKLSTKGRYGVTAMYDLAMHTSNTPISLKSIAERQGISENYLEKLMLQLRKAGLVVSVRGTQGGYLLSRKPMYITVGDIIRVTEGPIAPVDCLLSEQYNNTYCDKADVCVTRNIWEKVASSISDVLDSITLADLCNDDINKSNINTKKRK